AILDADKEGFLRSERSLVQTAGRAARNVNGLVIMYADSITDSMAKTIEITNLRRQKQEAYNQEHGIEPTQIRKSKERILLQTSVADRKQKEETPAYYIEEDTPSIAADPVVQYMGKDALEKTLAKTRKAMEKAARELDFMEAARLRDEMYALERMLEEKQA
ncbi:MAG: UvrB/UvrC motif-containing protein, partial [Bacteroidota bacterium]